MKKKRDFYTASFCFYVVEFFTNLLYNFYCMRDKCSANRRGEKVTAEKSMEFLVIDYLMNMK